MGSLENMYKRGIANKEKDDKKQSVDHDINSLVAQRMLVLEQKLDDNDEHNAQRIDNLHEALKAYMDSNTKALAAISRQIDTTRKSVDAIPVQAGNYIGGKLETSANVISEAAKRQSIAFEKSSDVLAEKSGIMSLAMIVTMLVAVIQVVIWVFFD